MGGPPDGYSHGLCSSSVSGETVKDEEALMVAYVRWDGFVEV